jgi:hypothetical protein
LGEIFAFYYFSREGYCLQLEWVDSDNSGSYELEYDSDDIGLLPDSEWSLGKFYNH